MVDVERSRLHDAELGGVPWRRWGPYLSERQWGTVREDYSAGGDAWSSFTHDQARSRAYRWGEDGLAGFSDDGQRLCLALALWNGRDPILKERLFGLTNGEGNHGEDVKEYYFYLDATPTASYLKMLYKYPQAAFHAKFVVPATGRLTLRLRLSDAEVAEQAFNSFDEVISTRRREAEQFWAGVTGDALSADERLVVRQALAGMVWSKQYYGLDVEQWLTEHGVDPMAIGGSTRNREWRHMVAHDVISMPDKWEYPWFAAWDLAFHAVAFAAVDTSFAKQQLELLLDRRYLHPNGQLSAYEWNFGDVNPPVHAWATYFVYEIEKARTGIGDRRFLDQSFQKMMRNFVWWLNRKDLDGRNVFQGGFLGLDNIGVFDRSAPLPTGGHLDQADGTAWMALCTQNMMQIALELAHDDPVYQEQALALFENLAWISAATRHVGLDGVSLWDDEDGFFYDVLRRPDGSAVPLKVRSVVGLMPLAAATIIPASVRTEFPELVERATEFLYRHPAIMAALWGGGRQIRETGPVLFALFDEARLRRILARMLDENEFLGPHGIRSVSRWHQDHPYTFTVDGHDHKVAYLPAESDTGMFGGNSNWRGPMWFPINLILLRALLHLYAYAGDRFTVECPTGSGRHMNLYEVAREISRRLTGIFLRDDQGRRPVHGGQPILQHDPHWRDLLLFYEYFHGDNGAGIGASHQTGWTGTVALLPLISRMLTAPDIVARGLGSVVGAATRPAGTAAP